MPGEWEEGGGGQEPAREWKAIFQDGGFAARRIREGKGRIGLGGI